MKPATLGAVEAVRVGLVGAGPWARLFTAPLLASGPDCTLAAVWARRDDQAARLAGRHGTVAAGSFDELLGTCEAVAFAVPPDVQADLAARAAAAGVAVLLDKPIGLELDQAERLAEAVRASGVVSQLLLTNRYRPSMRTFLDDAAAAGARAGRATFLGDGAVPGSFFATPWRLERGGLLDLGPHVLDALDVALGPIVEVRAAGDPHGVVAVTCTHEDGAISQATLSATTPVDPSGLVVELFGQQGRLILDTGAADASDEGRDIRAAMSTIAAELATAVLTGVPHRLDVCRGLHLQRLIAAVAAGLD
jgi:predicted dehydrogenase